MLEHLCNPDLLNDGDFAASIIAACGISQAVLNGMETAGLLKVDLVSADRPRLCHCVIVTILH